MRNVYVSTNEGTMSGEPVLKAKDAVAVKMLEIYDKSQEFNQIVCPVTRVLVRPAPCIRGFPIRVKTGGMETGYSLDESRHFREILLAAELHVKEFA